MTPGPCAWGPGPHPGLGAIGALVMLAACGAADAGSLVTVRDSAGVEIVDNHAAPANVARWRLSDAPTLDIGVVEGDSAYQIFRARGAVRLEDGIVIANSGTRQLRFYDEAGRHVRSVGRRGEGPGEFRALSGVWRYGPDSLITWDEPLRRATVFDRDGNLGGVITLQQPALNPTIVTPFFDGSLFVVDALFDMSGSGRRQQYAAYARVARDGTLLDSLGRFPTFTTIPIRYGDGGGIIGSTIFGPRGMVAASPAGFVVGLGRDEELTWYDPGGTARRVARWVGGDRTVSSADVERYRKARLARARDGNDRRREQDILDQSPVADQFPALEDLAIDRRDNVWLRVYDRPGYDGPARWLVFDDDGAMTARVETPRRLRMFEIGADYVLGVFLDELDVEHVRLYELIKP